MTAFLKRKSAMTPDLSRIEMDGLTAEEAKMAESVANTKRLQAIESSWPAGSTPLLRPGRFFVHESALEKMCRKGLKMRNFWLFNDILIYGTPITKTKFTNQVVMNLHEISVESVEDSAEGSNGMQINDKRKSFLVYCGSADEKTFWLKTLKRFIKLSREMVGKDGENDAVDSRAVWVPDSKVKVCMVCNESTFSLRNRKHHCRNCGKVVCGPCSAYKAILNQQKPERVCRLCHTKLGGVNSADVPLLGAASTENAKMKSKTSGGDEDQFDSDEFTSSSDEDDEDISLAPATDETVNPIIKDAVAEVKEGRISMDEAAIRAAAAQWVHEQSQDDDAGPDAGASDALGEKDSTDNDIPDGPYGIALFDNDDPEHPDEISFSTNEILCLTRQLDPEWLEGFKFGVEPKRVGIFPSAFVEIKIAP